MQINDYTKQLAKARDDYADKAKTLREDYDHNLKNLQEAHETKEVSQRENYLKQKQDLEDNLSEISDRYESKSRDAVMQSQKEFRERLGVQQGAFEEEMRETREDMQAKLSNISDSYRKSKEEQEKYNEQLLSQKTMAFNEAQEARTRSFDDKVADLSLKNRDDFHNFQRQQASEKRDLIHGHKNELQSLVSESNLSRQKVMAKNQEELEILRDSHARESEAMRDHHTSAIGEVINRKEVEKMNLQSEYNNLTQNIIDRNESQAEQTRRVNERISRERENQFATDLQAVTRKSNEMVNSGGRVKNLEDDKRKLIDNYEGRIRDLRSNAEETAYQAQLDKERMNKEFVEQTREQTALADKQKAEVQRDLREFHTEVQATTKDKNDKVMAAYKKELTQTRNAAEAKSIDDRIASNQRLEEQRVAFSKTIDAMNTKNRETVNEIQEQNAKEQTKYIQEAKRNMHHEREDLKDDLRSVFARKEDSYEKRLENLEREKKSVVESYESKLTNLEKKYTKELEEMRVIMAETRAGDMRDFKRQLEMKERELVSDKLRMKQDFDTKLIKIRDRQETQLAKLHERFTQTLEGERLDHSREMKRKLDEAHTNYERLYDTAQMEKEQLKHQYEVRLEKLRQDRREAERISSTREDSELA